MRGGILYQQTTTETTLSIQTISQYSLYTLAIDMLSSPALEHFCYQTRFSTHDFYFEGECQTCSR